LRGYNIGSGTRIILLFLLIILLLAGGILWFNFLGFWDIRDVIGPAAEMLGLKKRTIIEDIEDPFLLENERIKMQMEAITLQREALDLREEELGLKENELNEMMEQVQEWEESLEMMENSFNQKQKEYEDERKNLEQLSRYLVGMPPDEATEILLQKEDIEIVKILRVTEELAQAEGEISLVAFWLSLMPPERASEITRKLVKKPIE
jgi:flagellar protein FlbB